MSQLGKFFYLIESILPSPTMTVALDAAASTKVFVVVDTGALDIDLI